MNYAMDPDCRYYFILNIQHHIGFCGLVRNYHDVTKEYRILKFSSVTRNHVRYFKFIKYTSKLIQFIGVASNFYPNRDAVGNLKHYNI